VTRAQRAAAELARLDALGVHPGAALVLAEGVARRWHLRGDTAQAYNRHRREASPLAREAAAARRARQRAAEGRR